MSISTPLSASVVAGLIALDITGIGPFMISQPIVCGPLFGLITGHVEAGVLAGAIIQLLWMDVTPVGVGIPYDSTAATILTVYWSGQMPDGGGLSVVPLMLLLAVPSGVLFRYVDQKARRINTYIARAVEHVSDAHLSLALVIGTAFGVFLNWFRYALSFFIVMFLGNLFWEKVPSQFPQVWQIVVRGMGISALLLPVAGIGVVLEYFLMEEPERKWTALLRQKPSRSSVL